MTITDDGIITINMKFHADKPAFANEVSATVDLYKAANAYAELAAQHTESNALHEAWANWLIQNGFPPLSHRAGLKVLEGIMARIDALKKADGDSPNVG